MKKFFVIKAGGNTLDDENQLEKFLNDFSKIKQKKILVHGGGKIASTLSAKLGIESKIIDGRRITGTETLQVVQMTYAGLINKNIVAQLQAKKCNALGLTGADANTVLASKRVAKMDYGFVGDIKKVNIKTIFTLLHSGFVPVIAPLTHDGKGQMLNTNADTIASAVAVELAKKFHITLIYCFEKPGVLKNPEDKNSVIERINSREYSLLKESGTISQGMIPKLDNAFDAIKRRVKKVVICHAKDLRKIISGKKAGTQLKK